MLPLVLLLPFFAACHAQNGCQVDVQTLHPQPLLLDKNHKFVYPQESSSIITVDTDEILILSCPGAGFFAFPDAETLPLLCNKADEFESNGVAVNILSLTCNSNIVSSVTSTGKACANNTAELLQAGYQVDEQNFVPVLNICFNETSKSTLYVNYTIPKFIQSRPGDDYISEMEEDPEIYNLASSLTQIFEQSHATANFLIGLDPDSRFFFPDNFYHTPLGTHSSDFFYAAQAAAAYRFLNTFPHWPFVSSNWAHLMIDVSNFTTSAEIDLEEYSGTHGVLKIPHYHTLRDTEIYLYFDSYNQTSIAVPETVWKLLYHPQTKRAIVLLMFNTDYYPNVEDYVYCHDLTPVLPWLDETYNYKNLTQGYVYACSYYTAKSVITHLPDLDVNDILY